MGGNIIQPQKEMTFQCMAMSLKLETIMVSERSQAQRDKYSMIPLI